jgi:hypothetical protein
VEAQPDNSKDATSADRVNMFIAPIPGEGFSWARFSLFPGKTELVIGDGHYYSNE